MRNVDIFSHGLCVLDVNYNDVKLTMTQQGLWGFWVYCVIYGCDVGVLDESIVGILCHELVSVSLVGVLCYVWVC